MYVYKYVHKDNINAPNGYKTRSTFVLENIYYISMCVCVCPYATTKRQNIKEKKLARPMHCHRLFDGYKLYIIKYIFILVLSTFNDPG